MANHKSAIKRIRSSEVRKSANRLQHKTARNAVRNLRNNINKKEAKKQLPKVISMLDKLVKKNIILMQQKKPIFSIVIKYLMIISKLCVLSVVYGIV